MPRFLLPVAFALLTPLPQSTSPAISNADGALHSYESCHFQDGLQVVQVDALPPGVQERSVDTRNGPRVIKMLAGRRVMLAYATGRFVANIKPEILPADLWGVEKQSLLDELTSLLASDHGNVVGMGLPNQLHGLEVHGFERSALTGGVLGLYMLFDDTRHIATSVSLLNQEPLTRRFQTIEQYRQQRDRILDGYAACVAQNQALEGTSKAR